MSIRKIDGIVVDADTLDGDQLADLIPKDLLTAQGDIITRSTTAPKRLAKGAAGTILEMGANEPGWGAKPARLTVVDSEAFDGTSPNNVWTDLDLSGIVGANVAVVFLKWENTGTAGAAFYVRKKGETLENPAGGIGWGGSVANDTQQGYAETVTNASGLIEWKTSTAQTGKVTVYAFIK